ncbi:MAG TPA: acyl-ACP--UDP-N-acetylglucosamine O-acyltransferase [Abditibacteriaceae bacterium]|jgi:UDP-N-acetylglucosamine acyltransferase
MSESVSAEVTDSPVKKERVERPRVQMAKVPFPDLPLPLGYEEITKILPHRYPFLLVDRIVEIEPGVRCVGIKNVTLNEEFFQGHFPGHPVMPGVLILEAMAQVAGVLTLVSRNTPGALSYFAAIEKARFRRPVRPGDQIVIEATLQILRGALCKVNVVGRVDGEVVVEADQTFMTTNDTELNSNIVRESGADGFSGANSNGAQNGAAANGNGVHAAEVQAQRAAISSQVAPPQGQSSGETFVHPTALVDKDAVLDEGAWVGPYCIVEGETRIGKGTVLEANVVVKRGTTIGARCRIWPGVVLGHDPQDMKFHGEKSYVEIGDDNMLREMVTIHRATGEGEKTVIGNSNLLMAYVHVGHNCTIGSNTMISNSTGISGHVTIEDKVVIGGFVGIHQFVHIGKMGMIGGLSKVVQDVPPFCISDGRPAKIHGLNTRGLRRNGVPTEVRNQVATAFKLLYRSDLNTSQALEKIHAEIPRSETLDYFIDFVERVREGRLGRQDETPHF